MISLMRLQVRATATVSPEINTACFNEWRTIAAPNLTQAVTQESPANASSIIFLSQSFPDAWRSFQSTLSIVGRYMGPNGNTQFLGDSSTDRPVFLNSLSSFYTFANSQRGLLQQFELRLQSLINRMTQSALCVSPPTNLANAPCCRQANFILQAMQSVNSRIDAGTNPNPRVRLDASVDVAQDVTVARTSDAGTSLDASIELRRDASVSDSASDIAANRPRDVSDPYAYLNRAGAAPSVVVPGFGASVRMGDPIVTTSPSAPPAANVRTTEARTVMQLNRNLALNSTLHRNASDRIASELSQTIAQSICRNPGFSGLGLRNPRLTIHIEYSDATHARLTSCEYNQNQNARLEDIVRVPLNSLTVPRFDLPRGEHFPQRIQFSINLN